MKKLTALPDVQFHHKLTCIKVWSAGDTYWASKKLAEAYLKVQGDHKNEAVCGTGFMVEAEGRVFIPIKDTFYELGTELEVEEDLDVLRRTGLAKLTTEERRALGL